MSKTARQAERIDGRRVVDWDINGVPILEGRELPLPRYDNREHHCCGALASGPHKMGCDYKLVATKYSNEINELQQKLDDFVRASGHQIKPCRCGPDGCADSECPGRGEG